MKIYKKLKFLNRFTSVSRKIYDKKNNLKIQEIDMIAKLMNFAHFDLVKPNLEEISKNSGVSVRTFSRILKGLKDKQIITSSQNRDERGLFKENTYDLSNINTYFNSNDNQLSLEDFCDSLNNPFSFGAESSTLNSSVSPRVLDSFQKELNINTYEIVFIKFLLSRTDENAISEISLNWVSKYTVFTRKKLTEIIKSLQEKKLILIKEQFLGKSKIKTMNRYSLIPLLEKLNELEKAKVQKILESQGKWVDYNSLRVHNKNAIEKSNINTENEYSIKDKKIKDRIIYLEKEIENLKKLNPSKDSGVFNNIREFELELNSLRFSSAEENSISFLIKKRLNELKNNSKKSNFDMDIEKAKQVSKKLNGNWQKDKNFYIKAVKVLPNTVDRWCITSLEKAKISADRYFKKLVGEIFTQQKEISI